MTTQVENPGSKIDGVKWGAVVVLLVAATLGNHYLDQVSPWLRWGGLVVAVLVALGLALTTTKGRDFLELLKEAQVEARKIVWPKKEETYQTTLIVLGVVVVMSLVLWGLDTLFGWVVSSIIG